MSRFDKLAVETIVSIFHLTIPSLNDGTPEPLDPRRAQFALIATCRRWREIAICQAALWTTIFIILPCPNNRSPIIKRMVEWSAGRPLSIYVANASDYDPDDGQSIPHMSAVPELIQSLIPNAELLWFDADPKLTSSFEGIESGWFPLELPESHKLRRLVIGPNSCQEMGNGEDLVSGPLSLPLDIVQIKSYTDNFPSALTASPRELFIHAESSQEVSPEIFDDFTMLSRLERLSLTFHMDHNLDVLLIHENLRSLDILLAHESFYFEEEILIIDKLPLLENLVIRVGPRGKQGGGHHSPHLQLPPLPALKKIILKPSIRHFQTDILYPLYGQCDCLSSLIWRAPNLIMLEVHQGHAIGALKKLHQGYRQGSLLVPTCPKLESIYITGVPPENDEESPELVAMSNEVKDLTRKVEAQRPGLRVEWSN
ncbi:hypothetical protein DL93DRAFT_2084881 [Clavulina sp. PMI_390]|nr:hypothetical protein DL93DRAFT_2084881 [Clavulina sp. PMI_390]